MGKQNKNCENKKFVVPVQPLTLVQNVSQTITSAGQLITFQKYNTTKFARLLPDQQSIKIRRTGTYIFTFSGAIQYTTNVSGAVISFALLKNGSPISETIQNRTVAPGLLSFADSLSTSFTFSRGDILTFEAESSASATTFVPSILIGATTFPGNGLTLTLQSLESRAEDVTNLTPNKYLAYYFSETNGDNTPGISIVDTTSPINRSSKVYVDPNQASAINTFQNEQYNLGNDIYVAGWGGISVEPPPTTGPDLYVTFLSLRAGESSISVNCVTPYNLASQVFSSGF